MVSDKLSIEKLCKELKLKGIDVHTQDFEYEAADASRIQDFIHYYKSTNLNRIEKNLLIKLILESFNDYFQSDTNDAEKIWNLEIVPILSSEYLQHQDILDDWVCGTEKLEDCFAITPLVRDFLSRVDKGDR